MAEDQSQCALYEQQSHQIVDSDSCDGDDQSGPMKECRICFGRKSPFIQPCDCRGSMAYVHSQCLKQWLESKHSMQCELCHFQIRSNMTMRSPSKIAIDLIRALLKKFKKDKYLVLKLVLYPAYIFISGKKAVSCFRLLAQQLRRKYESLSFNILSILYLFFVLIQLFVLYTSEISQIYRRMKMKLRLICYEMTFENK